MRFRALGPLEVCHSQGRPVELTGAKPRALLSLFLAEPGRVLSMDRIVERLWSQEPPPSAVATVQSYIAQLRRLLEPDRGPRAASTVVLTRGIRRRGVPGPGRRGGRPSRICHRAPGCRPGHRARHRRGARRCSPRPHRPARRVRRTPRRVGASAQECAGSRSSTQPHPTVWRRCAGRRRTSALSATRREAASDRWRAPSALRQTTFVRSRW